MDATVAVERPACGSRGGRPGRKRDLACDIPAPPVCKAADRIGGAKRVEPTVAVHDVATLSVGKQGEASRDVPTPVRGRRQSRSDAVGVQAAVPIERVQMALVVYDPGAV